MSKFNEDSRVKIPAILHLTRLGYEYLSLKESKWNKDNNIFHDIFMESISKINPKVEIGEIERLYKDICDLVGYEDLGRRVFSGVTLGIRD